MQRSKHALSRYHLLTMNQGELIPCCLEEVLPGDSFRHKTSALIRVQPLVSPVMHPVHACVHHWFVPSRILWTNWEAFITGRDKNLVVPTITFTKTSNPLTARLAEYFGVGVDVGATSQVLNALPFRAYNKIWDEFYRDQNLNASLTEPEGDTDVPGNYAIKNVSWEKDYYTTARPEPQQGAGGEAVNLVLDGEAPIRGIGKLGGTFIAGPSAAMRESTGSDVSYANYSWIDGVAGNNAYAVEKKVVTDYPNIRAQFGVPGGPSVTMDINAWRQSMAYQKMREHRNRFGSRYTDMLAYLGITSSDARLQRPEYLGGGKQTISFSEVLSTAEVGGNFVGDMAGHGIAALGSRPYKRFFEEHGYVISLMFVRPVTVYQNRIPRTFLRRDYEQFWQKELEMMGDQVIQNNEIYGDAPTPSGTFGYIPRYDEYRHGESVVAGEFRTSVSNSWHMARAFTSQPVLNGTFVSADPTTRIYANTTMHQLYCMVAHQISARRLVSKTARN